MTPGSQGAAGRASRQAGAAVQLLMALAALAECPGFDPQFPHWWLTTAQSPVPEDPMAFSGLRGHLHTYGTHGYVQAHVYTHKTKGKSFLKSLDRGQGAAL